MKFLKKAKRGFTLVELVVVIAVIAILAAVSVGAYFGVTESANKSKLEQESKQFQTAIQTVALVGNENHTLSADGLRVSDIDKFELALEETVGQDIEVLDKDPTYIAKQTLVLKTSELVKSEEGAPVVYKTFEYYTAEISGKKIAVDVVTGDFAHATSNVVIDKDGADVSASTLYYQGAKDTNSYRAYLWAGEGENKVENAPFPGVEINTYAKVLDIWAFDSSNIYSHVKLTYRNGSNPEDVTTDAIALPKIEANTPYYNNGTWSVLPEVKNASTAGKTVYINEWDTAEKVYAYAFTFNLDKENATWPGVEMTRDANRSDRLASYTFDQDYHTVIFNNGTGGEGNQTDNLPLADVDFDSQKFFYNVTEEKWDVIPDDVFVAPTSVGIKGTMTNWASEVPFTSSQDGKVWTLEKYPLVAESEFKLAVNGEYTIGFDELSEEDQAIFEREEENHNIKVKDAAYYSFTYNAQNYTLDITKGEIYEGEEVFVAPESISIIGQIEDTSWNHDFPLVSTDEGHTWTGKVQMKANDQFKIRMNNAWAGQGGQDWGAGALAEGTEQYFEAADENNASSNIIVKESYIFNLKFVYDIKEISVIGVEDYVNTTATVTLIGSRTGTEWTDFATLTTEDGVIYSIDIDMTEGETFKLRKNNAWDISWGSDKLKVVDQLADDPSDDGNNIKVLSTGKFSITFNINTEEISNTFIAVESGEEPDPTPNPGEGEEPIQTTLVYLKPNLNWTTDNARFAAYMWDSIGDNWLDLKDEDGDGIYLVEIPVNYQEFKFVRLNPDAAENNWTNKWNETGNLTVPSDDNNSYVIPKDCWDNSDNSEENWMTFNEAKVYEYPADPVVELRTIYLDATDKDDDSNAFFEAWTWGSSKADSWVKFTFNEEKNLWETQINSDCTGMKILRKGRNSHSSESWDCWNQTGDISIPNNENCFVWTYNQWDNNTGEWKTI